MTLDELFDRAKPLNGTLPLQEQKDLILYFLAMVVTDPDSVGAYSRHVGFDVDAVRSADEFEKGWLAHYCLKRGQYDVDRAARDALTWPPIARYIEERLSKAVES